MMHGYGGGHRGGGRRGGHQPRTEDRMMRHSQESDRLMAIAAEFVRRWERAPPDSYGVPGHPYFEGISCELITCLLSQPDITLPGGHVANSNFDLCEVSKLHS